MNKLKRFTQTEKWEDVWFRRLDPPKKLLWQWLLDKCDSCGVIEPDFDLASFQIGTKISSEMIEDLGDRVIKMENGKLFIPKFIQFQYGKLSHACKPHLAVFSALEKHGIELESIKQNEAFSNKVDGYIRQRIIARDGYRCAYFDIELDETNAVIDHILPKSRGGSNSDDNLVVASISANALKRDYSVDEFCRREGLNFDDVCSRISARIGKPFGRSLKKPKGYHCTLQEKEEEKEQEQEQDQDKDKEQDAPKAKKRTNIAEPELNTTTTTADLLNGIEAKIQSLKPEWRIALTYAEQTCLRDNLRSVESITEEDWSILRDFLAAKVDKAEGFWQPWSRSKFVETIGDVHISALRWASKNRRVRKEGWK